MTVISARWRSHRPFQRKRKWHIPVPRYRKKSWRRVHISAWEFEGNIRPTSWVPVSWVQRASGDRRVELRRWTQCSRKSQNPGDWTLSAQWSSHRERERHNDDGHNFGVQIYQLYSVSSSLSHANFEQPFRNIQIKMRGKIYYKEVFRVFLACVVCSCDFIIVRLFNYLLCRCDAAWTCICVYKHIYYVSI